MRKSSTMLIALVSFVAVIAGACGGDRGLSIDTDQHHPELLYLGSQTAITAISPRSGAV
jgi:hypothetical protein